MNCECSSLFLSFSNNLNQLLEYIVGKLKKDRRSLIISLLPRSMVFSWSKPPSMLMKEERPMRIEKNSARKREQETGKSWRVFFM